VLKEDTELHPERLLQLVKQTTTWTSLTSLVLLNSLVMVKHGQLLMLGLKPGAPPKQIKKASSCRLDANWPTSSPFLA
jgi:hypothetical protein